MSVLDAARALVTSPLVSALLYTHPNDLAVSHTVWPFNEPWWTWASDPMTSRWVDLLEYYSSTFHGLGFNRSKERTDEDESSSSPDIPLELRQLIAQVCALALPRNPINITTGSS
ncbi:hypothetical protein B0H11DRAFT_1979351 [Mycena galericulata]|nr:hypothetical protein B0H11DRAFT_1979351 [Mycena galericulata]